ncbi:hypothetical protein KHC28_01280 [Ancylobacter sonchi]|uniref:hypothetical protein n=1 Tax=Ancylobacter sonchi TaxID=1937790 RepID=UPI001BD4F275|nr:hypothetical protein [Ancylobacter sonchi]MBS7532285.1 hypothetical protein [Ancylobacter sonchi]
MEGIRIELRGSTDDGHPNNDNFQNELAALSQALAAAQVPHSQIAISLHSQGAMEFLSPELFVTAAQVGVPALAAILGAWVQARWGRRVRLKIGDLEVEAGTMEEVEQLLRLARDHQKSSGGHGEGEV